MGIPRKVASSSTIDIAESDKSYPIHSSLLDVKEGFDLVLGWGVFG